VISLTVFGTPIAQGSKRLVTAKSGRPVLIESAKGLGPWRAMIKQEAGRRMHEWKLETTRAPVQVSLYFYFQRPQSHYGTGRNAHQLLPSAPSQPAVQPDIDKIARAVLDALTGTVFADDKQVVSLVCRKHYADAHMPGVTVEVLEVV